MYRKVTPTSLLTIGTNAVVGYIIGAFSLMVLSVFFGLFYMWNVGNDRIGELDVQSSGYAHFFEGAGDREGSYVFCRVVSADNGHKEVETVLGPKSFCNERVAPYTAFWEKYTPKRDTPFLIPAVISVVIIAVVMLAAYVVTSVLVLGFFYLFVRPLIHLVRPVAFALTAPFAIVTAIALFGMWNTTPTTWMTPDGYSVVAVPVYITKDNKLYRRPLTTWDVTKSETGQEVKYGK